MVRPPAAPDGGVAPGGQRIALQSFSPKFVPAGTEPLTITFDPAEIRAAIEKTRK